MHQTMLGDAPALAICPTTPPMTVHGPTEATLGVQRFTLRCAAVALVPPLDGVPVTLVDGVPVVRRCDGDTCYFVLDYREQTAVGPAYMEWWVAEAPVEGGFAGLFLLTATHRAPTLVVTPFALAALAAALTDERSRAGNGTAPAELCRADPQVPIVRSSPRGA